MIHQILAFQSGRFGHVLGLPAQQSTHSNRVLKGVVRCGKTVAPAKACLVEQAQARLRQKIEKDATAPTILVTEAGGYKLMP